MIDLYTWGTPNGRKVSILLEELGENYAVHPVDIGRDEQFDPAFLAISPNNKIPAIRERVKGVELMESGAILLYLAESRGRFLGEDGPEGEGRLRVVEWLMWQIGGLGPMAGQAHHFLEFNPGKAEYAEDRFRTETRRLYGVLDRRLAGRDFVAGEYSIADMAIWPWVSRFGWQRVDLAEFPAVRDWYRRVAERPAVRRGYEVPTPTDGIPMP